MKCLKCKEIMKKIKGRKKEKLLEIQEAVPEVEKKERVLYIAHFLWILYYKTRIHNIL